MKISSKPACFMMHHTYIYTLFMIITYSLELKNKFKALKFGSISKVRIPRLNIICHVYNVILKNKEYVCKQ